MAGLQSLSSVRLNERQIHLLEWMLQAGPSIVRGFRGARNWLLVRDGSSDHQQLLSLVEDGLAWQSFDCHAGFCRFHATVFGCEAIGLIDREIERALRDVG